VEYRYILSLCQAGNLRIRLEKDIVMIQIGKPIPGTGFDGAGGISDIGSRVDDIDGKIPTSWFCAIGTTNPAAYFRNGYS
jgi:hypothetical protein